MFRDRIFVPSSGSSNPDDGTNIRSRNIGQGPKKSDSGKQPKRYNFILQPRRKPQITQKESLFIFKMLQTLGERNEGRE